jgi:hypothetical protein
VIPIHLNELSPPAFRSSFPGITYQLGNMISSPSAQIVNAIAESHLVTAVDGEAAPAYGPTMGVATAIIAIGKPSHRLSPISVSISPINLPRISRYVKF